MYLLKKKNPSKRNYPVNRYINDIIESKIKKILEQQLRSINSKTDNLNLNSSALLNKDSDIISNAFNYSINQITSQLFKTIIKKL